jgi:hypothetical protein
MSAMSSLGLHQINTEELTELMRAIARDQLVQPITRSSVLLSKWGHREAHLDALIGQSKTVSLAILAAVLRERQNTASTGGQLVWSGPPPSGSGTRAPYDVLLDLIATAQTSLWFCGAQLHRDARALSALHAAQRGRSLTARVILAETAEPAALQAEADALFRQARPRPTLYRPQPEHVHAQLPLCLLADARRGLILAGAAATPEASDQAISAGYVLDDPRLVNELQIQWQLLIDSGAFVPLRADDA